MLISLIEALSGIRVASSESAVEAWSVLGYTPRLINSGILRYMRVEEQTGMPSIANTGE